MNEALPPAHTPTRGERRAEAREKARALRESQRKKERRTLWIVQGSIAVVVVAIIAVVALVLTNSVRPEGDGPLNMASDGIKIGQGFEAVATPARPAGARPIPSEPNPAGVVEIQIFIDYLCPRCAEFDDENGELIRTLIESGAATVEYHPLSTLTNLSAGTRYSLRSANAAACVANYAPNRFLDFHEALFANQPEEGTPGLTDDELVELAARAGVDASTVTLNAVEKCVRDLRFRDWVQAATDRALEGPLPIADTTEESIAGTPAVFVNGDLFEFRYPFEQSEFSQFVLEAAGAEFATNPTPTPTPTPSP
ncbi:thioredoxin domain-containing protein [Chryseoglobus sp. 28M-23]|uniref:DsbA family protein n=1 Tax=Chryseoglobus sp. 28M-23 TaxID=2772253 RepID=UPI00174621EE|nr:thioredoxin domain-containing protein [Chryseoglobus sp. 28M-23]MBU1251400.1 DsbA family protein [Actinomycetota bacterium]MBU1609961.1 DsbA family protein [Actinomycetota bacterium]MBU2315303.1 DsbA family protein [Actinomycetota bacterium]MBU2384612.1 DsbA family protein [Actinomycetota bacterium]QOD93321.1 thioredoxin domain-containing protein [Chryseoglobus sp. 28M-23]